MKILVSSIYVSLFFSHFDALHDPEAVVQVVQVVHSDALDEYCSSGKFSD